MPFHTIFDMNTPGFKYNIFAFISFNAFASCLLSLDVYYKQDFVCIIRCIKGENAKFHNLIKKLQCFKVYIYILCYTFGYIFRKQNLITRVGT